MASVHAECCLSLSVRCSWCSSIPKERSPITTERDITPYTRRFSSIIELDDSGKPGLSVLDGTELIHYFFREPEEPENFVNDLGKVAKFCHGATLLPLKLGHGLAGKRPVALLDERSSDGKVSVSRPHFGALTPQRLYEQLSENRFNLPTLHHEVTSDPGLPQNVFPPSTMPDADRRLLYITNLDCWTVFALIATAPGRQVPALREAIYTHISFQPTVSFDVSGPRSMCPFQLSFHIPFYVWRSSNSVQQDLPRMGDGRYLRRSDDLSFLSMQSFRTPNSSTAERDFLYQAHVTCVLAGTDNCRWTTYFFLDTYFDGEEDVGAYVPSEEEGPFHPDPLTAGSRDADRPILDPRQYYLVVFRIRLLRVEHEWRNVVDKLEEKITIYTDQHPFPLSTKEQEEPIREAHDWTVKTRRLLWKLIGVLSSFIGSCDNSAKQKLAYFANMNEHSRNDLQNIDKAIAALKELNRRLNDLQAQCTQFAKDLELHLFLDSSMNSHQQQKSAEYSKALNIIMLVFAPIALTSSVFSIPPEVNFFTPNSRLYFVFLGAFTALALIMKTFLLKESWIWHVWTALLGTCKVPILPKLEYSVIYTRYLRRRETLPTMQSRTNQEAFEIGSEGTV